MCTTFRSRLVAILMTVAVVPAAFLAVPGVVGAATNDEPTGPELLVGWIGSETAAQQPTKDTSTRDTMDAWARWTNSHGGVNGHPVKFAYAPDDKGDPAVAMAGIKDLIENKKVVAVVGATSLSAPTWAEYVKEQNIPVIGPQNGDPLAFTNPMFYGVGGSVLANLWGQMKSAAEQGVKKVGVVLCSESPQCAQARPLFEQMAEDLGMELSYDALASATQPSYTAECLAAKESGAQAVAAFVNLTVFARDCARQGFEPKWISSAQGPWPAVVKTTPALGTAVGASSEWTCLGPKTKGTKDFYTAMAKYYPEYKPGTTKYNQYGPGSCRGWAAGEVLKAAVEKAAVDASTEVTTADVIRGLSMFQGETVGEYTPELTYSDGTTPNPMLKCIYLYKYRGEKLVRVPSGPTVETTCMP